MLSNEYFYFALVRKYVAAFGSLFNNMIIQRTNQAGDITQIINVPISYAEKDKMMTRMREDPSIDNQASIVLPQISFFLDGYMFDSERHSSSNGKYIIANKPDITWQYKEVPWNFNFRVWIYVKNNSDASKILEQILPFFGPAYTAKLLLIPGRPPVDVPIVLRNVAHLDQNTEDFKQRSMLIWELAFTMKGYLYGPIQTNKPIKLVNIKFFDAEEFPQSNTINNENFGISNNLINITKSGKTDYSFTSTTQPGLTVNGQPTTLLANSMSLDMISYDDDWGIVEAINQIE